MRGPEEERKHFVKNNLPPALRELKCVIQINVSPTVQHTRSKVSLRDISTLDLLSSYSLGGAGGEDKKMYEHRPGWHI